MLLEKPIADGDCITIKLTSGEEVLGAFSTETENGLVVDKPATISATPEGKMGIIPWMMTSRATKVTLNKTTVVAYARTEDEISKSYTQSTTSIKLA